MYRKLNRLQEKYSAWILAALMIVFGGLITVEGVASMKAGKAGWLNHEGLFVEVHFATGVGVALLAAGLGIVLAQVFRKGSRRTRPSGSGRQRRRR